jgi:hypothetical protein
MSFQMIANNMICKFICVLIGACIVASMEGQAINLKVTKREVGRLKWTLPPLRIVIRLPLSQDVIDNPLNDRFRLTALSIKPVVHLALRRIIRQNILPSGALQITWVEDANISDTGPASHHALLTN